MPTPRRTNIIATIGPATDSPEMLEQMIKAGMNVARINMSHATHDQVRSIVDTIREVSARLDVNVAIMMDTQGPAIRTGDLPTALNLNPGDKIVLSVRGETSEEHHSVDVNYEHLVDDISLGDIVLVDNGTIHLKVIEKRHNQLHCEVLTEGVLGSRRHINLPGVRVNLPALTDKDISDIDLGIEVGVDYFAMSFVREAKDVMRLKAILDYRKAPQRVIAKLEDQQGVSNVDDIIRVSDAIMVARGDLGIECPYEELPIIQRRIVKHCLRLGRSVIVATHMLESMIDNPLPTRAEITDVANAVYEEADAIMLSGETTVGQHPLACLEVMDRIARRTEQSGGAGFADQAQLDSDRARLMKAACVMVEELQADALVIFSKTGRNARNAAWLRPDKAPIYAFTDNQILQRQLALQWGTTSFLIDFSLTDPADNVHTAMELLKAKELIQPGATIVAVTEINTRHGERVYTAQMVKV